MCVLLDSDHFDDDDDDSHPDHNNTLHRVDDSTTATTAMADKTSRSCWPLLFERAAPRSGDN